MNNINMVTLSDLKKMKEEQIKSFIRQKLSFKDMEDDIRYLDKELLKKEHKRFDMSGCQESPWKCVVKNQNILLEFAYLGIYDAMDYLFLNTWKGSVTLFYKDSIHNAKHEEVSLSGLGTVDIIYEIFKRTILRSF